MAKKNIWSTFFILLISLIFNCHFLMYCVFSLCFLFNSIYLLTQRACSRDVLGLLVYAQMANKVLWTLKLFLLIYTTADVHHSWGSSHEGSVMLLPEKLWVLLSITTCICGGRRRGFHKATRDPHRGWPVGSRGIRHRSVPRSSYTGKKIFQGITFKWNYSVRLV